MASLLNMSSSRLVGSKSLPYDAEIEYLESTGTQYIDTGLPENGCDFMELEFSDARNNGFFFVNSSSQVGIKDNRYGTTEPGRYKIKEVINGDVWVFTNLTNGTVRTQGRRTYTNIRLFAINHYQSISFFCIVRVYSFTCSLNGEKKRDMIPVRIGTTGYMYDKVSGNLFGNNGTGAFILGPDKTN